MKRTITPWVGSLAAAGMLLAGAADLRAQMSCRASAAEPRNLRTEGVAELLADVILECEGGTPVSDGQDLPRFQIIAAGSTPLTSRVLVGEEDSLFQWTEALLVIDDIAPQRQIPCASLPAAPSSEPPVEDTGCHLTTGPANVFQGQRLQENAVVFQDVAINPPGPGIVRKIRIVNLRADVRKFTDPVTTEPDPLEPPVDPSVPPEVFVAVYDMTGASLDLVSPRVADKGVAAAKTLKIIEGQPLVESVVFYDAYKGKGVPEGKSSLTFRIYFQSPERTLSSEEVGKALEGVVKALESEAGAILRGG